MRHNCIGILALTIVPLVVSLGLSAQERIQLTKPIVTTVPDRTSYALERFSIELLPTPRIIVRLAGITDEFVYPCVPTVPPSAPNPCTTDTPAKVQTLITALNTANLSTRSLWRRIFDRLILDFPSRFPGGATVQ